MATAKELLTNEVSLSDDLVYKERELDERFTAIEIYSSEDTRFNLFYYVVDQEDEKVFYGDFKLPDGVVIERIKRGIEPTVNKR